MLICKLCVTIGERETLYKLQLRVQIIQMLMIKDGSNNIAQISLSK